MQTGKGQKRMPTKSKKNKEKHSGLTRTAPLLQVEALKDYTSSSSIFTTSSAYDQPHIGEGVDSFPTDKA